MAYEVNGNEIEADVNGYLANQGNWNKDVAKVIAEAEGINLSEKAWEIINYLRDEYLNNGENQPNERQMVKHFKSVWTDEGKVDAKSLYIHFPKGPAKQASKVAGLPETKRKGGY
ncbi:MAG: TusE/DsrC/DsvC family sulfur relay protein [Candidatus Thiodiazotropha sp. (ex Lucinoma aequizonata)]|nr:TusE/DsrC/DsvC family sulfur relay protein [Candidatus Thiodiazotropha sp. (ex Lucinoma aequizonata)]MCU7895151.1 TusE/DsrC/DsvC family sulfur relay protein [Candidatus Thiodiazotropha sp. (ex Lucinoma aequizonata)]MCU7899500.1 TusE/DsrC/DsvC family sulfur relay protein [Candidatus Thiodiazotropha sp. (ex Lucinoma aequizonata)]MCU7903625.1 TusE/DsrC/DsvC family sulfur relay protein [Candidatus Thiodiazotropha sp. (ex Lucinoma aequizonata)]MCU7913147.1 TusE/DsrC/DsvC family sulfur relay prote